MSESFVDLTYRGLSLGKKIKLADVRPTTGYVEMPAPMPVGTQIAIHSESGGPGGSGVAIDAMVLEVHEQVAGSEKVPGMVVKPVLEGDAAIGWWKERVTLGDAPPPTEPVVVAPVAAPTPAPVVVVSKRMTNPGMAVPEIVDDGQVTGVMDVVAAPESAEGTGGTEGAEVVDGTPVQDDGKKTTAMDAVDLAALGLVPASGDSGPIGMVQAEGEGDTSNGTSTSNGDKPAKKKKRRR